MHLRIDFVMVTAFARPALVMCIHLRQSRILEAVQPVDVGEDTFEQYPGR